MPTRLIAGLVLIASCIAMPAIANGQLTSSQQLTQLIDEIWQYELSISPMMAESEGLEGYSHLLSDVSPQALAEQNEQFVAFKQQLMSIPEQGLSREEQITRLMQAYSLDDSIDSYRFSSHFVPLTSEYGFHGSIGGLPRYLNASKVADYENYIARLTAIPTYFEQNIHWLKQGMQVGMTQPKVALQGFEESIAAFIVDDPEKSSFYAPFKTLPSTFSAEEVARLQASAKQAIANSVVPAYQNFYDFMVEQYLPNAKEDVAAKNWPNGEAYYQNRIKHYTTTDMTAKEIHELGLAEVARIRGEMQAIVDKLEFNGSIDDFIQFLRTDEQFYATSAEELLKEASFIAKKMDARLPQLFDYLPRTPYGVAPVPDSIAPKYTTGRYVGPSRDNQPGYYWVNTYALDKRPLYALPALTLHEAVPGHHLQISLAAEMTDLPKVRRETYISAFGEGWGLYSEFLGIEVGIYEDPYDDFGRLSYEMWRACRLVVDTGMHMFGWTRQQALDYMLKNTALSEHNVKTEIDRYITWPAQALSYKIGEIKIKQLRELAQQQLGDDFDIRAFHRAVLAHGSVPLFVLEQNIQQFIAETKESNAL